MPEITCQGCGRQTNTATADHLDAPPGTAERCFIAWVDGQPVKGCGWDDTDAGAALSRRLCRLVLPGMGS